MCVGFDGIIFRRQTVCIKADGEQDVVALHAALTGDDFQTGVRLDVTDVHTCAGRIREFNQTVELLFGMIFGCMEDTGIFPFFLPLFLNVDKIVLHGVCVSPYFSNAEMSMSLESDQSFSRL